VGSCIQTDEDVETLSKVEVMMLTSFQASQVAVLFIDSD
jgi:hypothetical protein